MLRTKGVPAPSVGSAMLSMTPVGVSNDYVGGFRLLATRSLCYDGVILVRAVFTYLL